jgi:diadenosine tetraphosphate (Ap4A) HIT family hydrolase
VDSPRVPLDLTEYERQVRQDSARGQCFICSIIRGERDDHVVFFRDDMCIAFLAKWPTLAGYSLVAPLEHRTNVVGDFTEDEYVDVQRRVHRVGGRFPRLCRRNGCTS